MGWRLILATGILAAIGASSEAAVKVGDKAPEFKLFGVDYKYHSLKTYPAKKAIVIVFTCNHCPVAVAYEDTLIAAAKTYQAKGVQFLAVNPNPADKVPADGFPQMIERAKQKGFPFPYVYDETQETAHAYGATCTPHVFVVAGKRRTVVYTGAIDNRYGKKPHYLTNALDDILAGRPVKQPTSKQFGCSVKYRKKPK